MRHHQLQPRPKLRAVASQAIFLLAMVVTLPTTGWAQPSLAAGEIDDVQLASIVVVNHPAQAVKKILGEPTCQVTAPDQATTTYIYARPQGEFLQVVVNKISYHVDFQLVQSLRMISLPSGHTPCPSLLSPVRVSPSQAFTTGNGIRLGDSIAQVTQVYGEPVLKQIEGDLVHLQYAWDQKIDHYYEWNLVFQNGRLMEWTVQAFPIFFEVGG
jgi:hypothetical protein